MLKRKFIHYWFLPCIICIIFVYWSFQNKVWKSVWEILDSPWFIRINELRIKKKFSLNFFKVPFSCVRNKIEWCLSCVRLRGVALIAMTRVWVLAAAAWVWLHAMHGMSFTASVWWFSLWGFLAPLEGLKIILIPIGTVSQGWGCPDQT